MLNNENNESKTSAASVEQMYSLITRRLPSIIHGEEIKQMLADGKTPKCFWATAPTGIPHIAYFLPMTKLAEFVKAGVDTTVLFCDIYAYMVNYDAPFEIVAQRTRYYHFIIHAVLASLGVPDDKVHFVNGSQYELTPRVAMDMYRLACLANQDEARDTGSEYLKSSRLSLLLCPGLPGLAEEYLNADFQFGGEDQRGLFEFNERFLPQLGYRRRAHMMNVMVPGLQGTKMSSSITSSKIELLDTPEEVRAKVAIASCPTGQIEGNGVLSVLKHIIFPVLELRAENARRQPNGMMRTCGEAETFTFTVPALESEPAWRYRTYLPLERDFADGRVSVHAVRAGLANAINAMLDPIRKSFAGNPEWQEVHRLAYEGRENWDLREEAEKVKKVSTNGNGAWMNEIGILVNGSGIHV